MTPTADEYREGMRLLQQQQRARLTAFIEQVDRALARDWQRSMGYAAPLYRPLIDQYARELAALRREMDDPSARLTLDWLTARNAQLRTIEQSVRASLDTYGSASATKVTNAQAAAAERGAADAAQLTQRSLWPAVEGAGVPPAMLFNRPNPDAIAQWVGRAGNGHPLGDLFANFGTEATQQARKEMLLGLATGANPRAMAKGISKALGISRSRATIISRTEVLGSYRSAAHETYRANSDVINGWLWSAGGNNPCAMCMGMDGLQFSLEEELVDHPCGKCSPIPVTRSWDDILGPWGIDSSDMLETSMGAEGAYETGEEKFARMSPQQQRAIIGTRTGYDAYRRGEVTLKDFIGKRPAENGFPPSYYQKSLKEMEIPTGRAGSNLVERSPRLTELERAGNLRLRDFGAPIPVDEMPVWAQQSPASQAVYQILRNGLPWGMREQEAQLLQVNLEQMLKEELPLNVRLAALRQQDVLAQYEQYLNIHVRNITGGASTLKRDEPPPFVYRPSKELERALAAARAGERNNVLPIREGENAPQQALQAPALAARLDRIPADATVADMQDWVKAQLPGIERVELLELDPQAARLVASASTNLIQELPDVAKTIWRIRAERTYSDALAYVPHDGLSLIINTEKWSDLAGIAARAPQHAAAGWWVTDTPEQIIGHEIGHMLQLNYHISNETWTAVMDRVAAAGGNPLVSTYAGNKVEESFAETFALLVYGDPTEAQAPIVREMARLLSDHGIDYTTLRAAVGSPPITLP